MKNVTAALGKDTSLLCEVKSLGGFKVGWLREDSKAIQAIHAHVVTHNPRVSVSHANHELWMLHIRNVQVDDKGPYICQVNTDPMLSQRAWLDVLIPPDIDARVSDAFVAHDEGEGIILVCSATGYPMPNITWKREDGQDILIEDRDGHQVEVAEVYGSTFTIKKLRREDMGVYVCIADNGVPPTVSRRYVIDVSFAPVLTLPNHLVGAPFETNVTFECYVSAFPKAVTIWEKGDSVIVSNEKYVVEIRANEDFEIYTTLTIIYFGKEDVGYYACVAKNVVGENKRYVNLYDINGNVVPVEDSNVGVHFISQKTKLQDDGALRNISRTSPAWTWEFVFNNEVSTNMQSSTTRILGISYSLLLQYLVLM